VPQQTAQHPGRRTDCPRPVAGTRPNQPPRHRNRRPRSTGDTCPNQPPRRWSRGPRPAADTNCSRPQDSRETARTGAPPLATTCTRCPRHPGPADRILRLHDGAIAPSEPAGAARGHHADLSDNDPAHVAVTRDDHTVANQLTIPDDHAANHFVISDDHLSSNISDDQTAHATIAPPATAGATSGWASYLDFSNLR
jgi:hypothetical protein